MDGLKYHKEENSNVYEGVHEPIAAIMSRFSLCKIFTGYSKLI